MKLFVPHELRTVEIDVEKKKFLVNGEPFGEGCTGFSIICTGYNEFSVRVEIDTTVQFATYNGIDRVSVSEHPAHTSTDREKKAGRNPEADGRCG